MTLLNRVKTLEIEGKSFKKVHNNIATYLSDPAKLEELKDNPSLLFDQGEVDSISNLQSVKNDDESRIIIFDDKLMEERSNEELMNEQELVKIRPKRERQPRQKSRPSVGSKASMG